MNHSNPLRLALPLLLSLTLVGCHPVTGEILLDATACPPGKVYEVQAEFVDHPSANAVRPITVLSGETKVYVLRTPGVVWSSERIKLRITEVVLSSTGANARTLVQEPVVTVEARKRLPVSICPAASTP